MEALLMGLLFGLVGASGVLFGAVIVLRLRRRWPDIGSALIAYAAGTLIGAAFLGLLPGAIENIDASVTMRWALAGVMTFFLLEKTIIWRHCHNPDCEMHHTTGWLILFGDAFHNFVDGIVIGTAFVMDMRLGVVTGIAILAHEIPQEVGDFTLLIEDGLSVRRALAYNLLSAATILPGVVVGDQLAERADVIAGASLALAAGGFIYVALADLVPRLHKRIGLASVVHEIAPVAAGIATIWSVQVLLS